MSTITNDRLKVLLDLYEPLATLDSDDENFWRLGLVQVSKKHAKYRVGYSYDLQPGSQFSTRPFDVEGKRGIAIILSVGGEESFAGWVQPEREEEANGWAATLNAEIKKRLDADDSYEKGVYDEAKAEFERTKHNKPSDLVARAKPKSPK